MKYTNRITIALIMMLALSGCFPINSQIATDFNVMNGDCFAEPATEI